MPPASFTASAALNLHHLLGATKRRPAGDVVGQSSQVVQVAVRDEHVARKHAALGASPRIEHHICAGQHDAGLLQQQEMFTDSKTLRQAASCIGSNSQCQHQHCAGQHDGDPLQHRGYE